VSGSTASLAPAFHANRATERGQRYVTGCSNLLLVAREWGRPEVEGRTVASESYSSSSNIDSDSTRLRKRWYSFSAPMNMSNR
jgi:hypothetical protein